MNNALGTVRAGVAVVIVMTILLMGQVNSVGLLLWAASCSCLLVFRWRLVQRFQSMMRAKDVPVQTEVLENFFRRYGWSWPLTAFLFAFPVVLYFRQAPEPTQYVCMMILVGMGTVGAALMSANLKYQRQFSHTLTGTFALALISHELLQLPTPPSRETIALLMLVALFWVSILFLGKYLHQLQRSSYSAQFGNEQLIRSLRQQSQAATEAVRMKNSLLASATHDLRQPVHALAFYADWLRNEPQLAGSVIPKILAATDSVNTLFNSLFDFARIEAGAIKVNLSEVNIHALIEEMAVQFAPAADQKGLYLRASPVQVSVQSDAILLRRIVANLLANAIRYTNQGGVMITGRVVGGVLWIEIADSGVGIAPEHLPHVFKEFYRAPVHEGTADSFGLGLAIVQRLCRTLGHVVTIRSVLGKGTRSRVEITLSETTRSDLPQASKPMPLEGEGNIYTLIRPQEKR
ncbi:MAG: HAMP domain-containing histidine kinase [Brachymonas sp.]|nr:HAMP domain-containing histidine kinase [Brachymonas sp.]